MQEAIRSSHSYYYNEHVFVFFRPNMFNSKS